MAAHNIVLKKNPKIEFQLLDNGFQVFDEQTERNSGFYAYQDLQNIELEKTWYPRFAKWLRIFTAVLNIVPLYPDAATCKRAKVMIHFKNTKLGMWLTDTYMVDKAKILKESLDLKNTRSNNLKH